MALTFQGMRIKTEYIMEQMRRDAIDYTMQQFVEADRRYYEQGYDNGEAVKLIKELERLGADMEAVTDIDLSIRDAVEEAKKQNTSVSKTAEA